MKLTIKGLTFLALMMAASFPIWADAIPYPNVGTIAPTTIFTAAATGNIEGYFAGFSASDTDEIRMCDVTTSTCSAYTFDNMTTAIGTSFNFGSVTAGNILVFDLDNLTTGSILSSDPADSSDGINHAYATAYTDTGSPNLGAGIPAGTFVGMEDLTVPGSDLDYNDDQFVFTDVATRSSVPEPGTLLMLGTGLLGLGGLRRKFFS